MREEFGEFAAKLDVPDLTFIPVSALLGDNIVTRSANMPWYEGVSLLHELEEVHTGSDRNLRDPRFPVQYVLRAPNRGSITTTGGTPARSPGGSSRRGTR